MALSRFLITYLTMLISFVVIDSVWLGFIAKDLYKENIGHLLTPKVIWWAAILFYLLFILGMLIFVVAPATNTYNPARVLLLGAIFGLITYATYDLTNLATLKGWPIKITIIDLIWGSFISAVVSIVGHTILNYLHN